MDKRLDIQGLRAIAVLLVIAFHFNLGLSRGYLGVDMFFVISGYVITLSTIRNIRSEKKFNWKYFYRRRVRRLLPGAAIVAVLSALFSLLALSPFGPQQKTATMLVSAATYSTNFALLKSNYYALDSASNPLLHFWSLAVEEQFYFLWGPVVLAVLAILSRHKQLATRVGLVVLGGLATAGSLALFVVMSHYESRVDSLPVVSELAKNGISPSTFAFYSPLTRLWEFMAGVLLALIDSRISRNNPRRFVTHCVAFIGVAMLILGLSNIGLSWDSSNTNSTGVNPLAVFIVVSGTTALLYAGRRQSFTTWLLALRPLTYIGDISYTLYLWHWPIWVFGLAIYGENYWLSGLCLVLSFALSIVQYHFIEDPIRRGHLYPQGTSIKMVGSFVVVALLVMTGMRVAQSSIGEKLIGTTPEKLIHHIVEDRCSGQRLTIGEASTCRFRPQKSTGIVILVGDSTAKSLSDGFVLAAHNLGLEALVFYEAGCPFQTPGSPFSSFCNRRNVDTWAAIRALRPQAVVVSNLNYLYVRDIGLAGVPLAQTRAVWASETRKIFEQLRQMQIEGLLVQPVPEFTSDVRYEVTLLKMTVPSELRASNAGNQFLNEMEVSAILSVADDRSILNLYSKICQLGICSQVQDGKYLYEDGSHLSSVGSLAMSPLLEKAIELIIRK